MRASGRFRTFVVPILTATLVVSSTSVGWAQSIAETAPSIAAAPAPAILSTPTTPLGFDAQPRIGEYDVRQPDDYGVRRFDYDEPPLIADVAKRVAIDPTTWAPAAIVYTSLRLDWDSSQPLFRMGYVETHPGYTLNGLPYDKPVGYPEGNRRIRNQALVLLGRSLANNAASAIIERALIARAPRHRKLIRTLGWIERTAFASYFSYVLSVRHFEQWQINKALAREAGAK